MNIFIDFAEDGAELGLSRKFKKMYEQVHNQRVFKNKHNERFQQGKKSEDSLKMSMA